MQTIQQAIQQQQRCMQCWLPLKPSCLCDNVLSATTERIDVAVAMHYKEYGRTKNTAKIIPLTLPQNCQLYSHPIETPALLERMRNGPSLVLWPGEESKPASEYRDWLQQQESRVLLTVLDGTWVRRGMLAAHAPS